MGFPTKNYREVRDDILRDIVNQQSDADTGVDSDFYVRANASGNAIEGLYEHQKWIARQIFPDTADVDILETKHARPRGITRKAASYATGSTLFKGVSGSVLDAGLAFTRNGVAFVTTAAGAIGVGGTASIAAKAVVAGAAGNQAAGTVVTLSSAPIGVQPEASIVAMTGGTEIETPEALLFRVLYDIAMPANGGSEADYFKWAMEVPGVTDAYVFAQRRTANSVDVVIETEGGVASQALLDQVWAYIESVRPTCVDLATMVPELIPVNMAGVLSLNGITLADALVATDKVLKAYFDASHVGDEVRKVKIASLILSTKGVVDVNLTSPLANVLILADNTHSQRAVLGTQNFTA